MGIASAPRRTVAAIELEPGDRIETPGDCSGEVLAATQRGAYIYVHIADRPEVCMLEPQAQVGLAAD